MMTKKLINFALKVFDDVEESKKGKERKTEKPAPKPNLVEGNFSDVLGDYLIGVCQSNVEVRTLHIFLKLTHKDTVCTVI